MLSSMNVILNLLKTVSIWIALAIAILWINGKIDKLNTMWMSSNQIVVSNLQQNSRAKSAFNDRYIDLLTYVESMPPKERSQWLTNYNPQLQALLQTPPSSLDKQGEV